MFFSFSGVASRHCSKMVCLNWVYQRNFLSSSLDERAIILAFQRQKDPLVLFGMSHSSCRFMSFTLLMAEFSGWFLVPRFVYLHQNLIFSTCQFWIQSDSLYDCLMISHCLQSFLIVSDPSIAKHILKDNSKAYSKVNQFAVCTLLICWI